MAFVRPDLIIGVDNRKSNFRLSTASVTQSRHGRRRSRVLILDTSVFSLGLNGDS